MEVKVDTSLELSEAQQAGYQACFHPGLSPHFALLVPRDWMHRSAFENSFRTLDWTSFIAQLRKTFAASKDAVVQEGLAFWNDRFEAIHMNEQELHALSTWPPDSYTAIRKLERTIRQVKGRLQTQLHKSGLSTAPATSDGEFAFYIKKSNSYLLWVGTWEKAPSALCFGYRVGTKDEWLQPSGSPPDFVPVRDNSFTWNLYSMPTCALDDVNAIATVVQSFLAAHYSVLGENIEVMS